MVKRCEADNRRPKIEVGHIDHALLGENSSGLGVDGWHPKDTKTLPVQAKQALADLLNAIESELVDGSNAT